MPFNMFATAGAQGFVKNFTNCFMESDIDKVLAIPSLAKSNLSSPKEVKAMLDTLGNPTGPSTGDNMAGVTGKIGKLIFATHIQAWVNYMAVKDATGYIDLWAQEDFFSPLSAPVSRSVHVSFSDFDNPGYQFMTSIRKALTDTRLYTVGVLRYISIATAQYSDFLGVDNDKVARLSITVKQKNLMPPLS